MANTGDNPPPLAPPSIFISYASQDREAARRLRDGLAAAGFDVWYDESELGGGDAWDQKIRRQIRECTYFMPVISGSANARHEGYFRREWRLAVERTLDMADDVTFLVPVAIDAIEHDSARVPDKFRSVQWLTLPGGAPTPAFSAWCARLLSGNPAQQTGPRPAQAPRPYQAPPDQGYPYPKFPETTPTQKHYVLSVIVWAFKYAFAAYRNMPRRWQRFVLIILCLMLFDQVCSHKVTVREPALSENAKEVKAAELGSRIDAAIRQGLGEYEPQILLVPFTVAGADQKSAAFCDSVFASLYGRLSMGASARVGLAKAESGPGADPLKVARSRDAKSVLYGDFKNRGDASVLEVSLADVASGAVLWTEEYPEKGADPNAVAEQIRARLQDKG